MLDIKTDKTSTASFEMAGKCPFGGDRIGGTLGTPPTLSDWYPNRLKVEQLHSNGPQANPLGDDFDYAAAFEGLDYAALKQDIKTFLTSSVAWWPSDYGNYGPQMIRMAWHAAGTYRIADGRGGAGEALQRFAPINSWWDNGNTDKSRRLIWPIKQKYGSALSWGDLMVLTGNCALEIMGFPTYGFAGGRHDAWEADTSTYWGPEVWDPTGSPSSDSMVTRDKRWRGKNGDADYDLENPLAASHQALIYVNPEGPYGKGDPMGSARDIRITFTRMAMNDEETVALIAGGHAFGKSHGMVSAGEVGPPPEIAPIEAMGMGWQNPEGTGFAEYTMTNGIEGSWTPNPTQWDNSYLENLFGFEWEQTRSPAGALQWTPVDPTAPRTPDAHVPGRMNSLMMMTSGRFAKNSSAISTPSPRRFRRPGTSSPTATWVRANAISAPRSATRTTCCGRIRSLRWTIVRPQRATSRRSSRRSLRRVSHGRIWCSRPFRPRRPIAIATSGAGRTAHGWHSPRKKTGRSTGAPSPSSRRCAG
jgi:catalase-peroxidase